MGFAPERLHVAPNALDQSPILRARAQWLAAPERLATYRRAHNVGAPLILFVSRLKPENWLDVLIEAAALLRTEHHRGRPGSRLLWSSIFLCCCWVRCPSSRSG